MRDSRVVVILGASNVTLGWSEAVRQLSARSSGSIQLFTAHGMGRSYLKAESGFMVWKMPGILHSGLWHALPSGPSSEAAPWALVTDVGNDLVFGSSADEVAEGARHAIDRLRRWDERIQVVLSRPPVDAVRSLGPARFRFVRSVLFPRSSLNLQRAVAEVESLDEQLVQIGEQTGARIFRPDPDWYGFDPIHVQRPFRSQAFGQMMELWPEATPANIHPAEPASRGSRRRIRRPEPERYVAFGKERQRRQPSLVADRLSVFAY